jgi:hypothetical protein
MMQKQFKTLNLDKETMNNLDGIAKVLNRHKSEIIREFVNNLTEVICSFTSGNISYETRITANMVMIYITTSGRSNLTYGTEKPTEFDEK